MWSNRWLSPTPLKNDGVSNSWGYYSQYMEKNVPNHQPATSYPNIVDDHN